MSTAVPTVNVDDITDIRAIVPKGRYNARLLAIEGKKSKKDNPMVVATFVVTSGEQEGNEVTIWYPLVVTEKKGTDGKTRKYAGGVMEAKRAFAAIGKPLPGSYGFPLQEDVAATLIGKRFKGVDLEIIVLEEKDREDPGKVRTRAQVVGLSGAKAAPAETSGGGLSDFDFGDAAAA